MHSIDGELIFSATDLSNFLACPHLSLLDYYTALGGPKPPEYDDPAVEVLRQRGLEHEQEYLAQLRSDSGLRVVKIEQPLESDSLRERWTLHAAATVEAMRSGVDIIYQGPLFDGTWAGKPDFLQRVALPSELGPWSYEIVDTKLARSAKGGALLQLLLYAQLVERVQGVSPERVYLALGGPEARTESFRVADYAAYFRSMCRRFLEHVARAPETAPYAPEPVAHCEICAWKSRCDAERRDADHLALVAGISRSQRQALVERGIGTVEAFAALTLPVRPRLERVSDAALERVREQARIQVEGRRAGEPRRELLLPVLRGHGLAALPEPSPGDLFFDLEGDAYALTYGIEYLFGFADCEGRYIAWWALSREEERKVFERFIDMVMRRLEACPELHIYHFGTYDPTALKRLMGRHTTREDQLDRLLRGKVFVDLHRVVRQGLRASVESYSIKKLEPFYGYERAVDLRTASSALAYFEAWLELGRKGQEDKALLEDIERYNGDDCVSTLQLRAWLERLRDDLSRLTEEPVPRPESADPAPSEVVAEHQAEVAALVAGLTRDVPADAEERAPHQHARWLLAQLLGFHRRENKSTWWEYFRCLELSDEEMVEDHAALGGLHYEGMIETEKRSNVHRYRFPPQEHGIREGTRPRDPATQSDAGEVRAIDDLGSTIDLKRGKKSTTPHPRALVPLEHVSDVTLRNSLLRIARAVSQYGLKESLPFRSAADLLLRLPPRVGQQSGADLTRPGETTLEAACRLVLELDRSVLPIQGPPGAGKTYTAARMIVRALQDGRRVGVTATSHKVISNLLDEACRAGVEVGFPVKGLQKAEEEQKCSAEQIDRAGANEVVRNALQTGEVWLAAGTAWLWCDQDMIGSVDLLFVDEAGQFSLANALAVAPAAGSMVLLGDPRQLEQPQQGVHPPGADVSALDHLLGEDATISADRGLFLEYTWRLHPEICAFTSEIFYSGRLQPIAGLERQVVCGPEPLNGTGLRLVAVEHTGNQSESPEEVEAITALIEKALAGTCTWTTVKGEQHPIELKDILVVAPYNVHVSALKSRLPPGARVGTVDKFQGQEAPIVIYTMATSSAEDAPRGMEFLYSPNRLNVATSRARCLSIVVASPKLFVPECWVPRQMKLANAFCRFRELAAEVSPGDGYTPLHRADRE